MPVSLWHGWDFLGYILISGFRFLSESSENSIEMHFNFFFFFFFSIFRIQTLTLSYLMSCKWVAGEHEARAKLRNVTGCA